MIPPFVHALPAVEFYSGARFWLYFVVTLVLMSPWSLQGRVRATLLLVVNLVMLLALPQFNGAALLIYAGLVVATFTIGGLLRSETRVPKRSHRRALAATGVLAVLFLLAAFKYSQVQDAVIGNKSLLGGGATGLVFLIGISYASFKAMHFVVESYKRSIENLTFLNYANYLLFFPSFVSGPIARYNDFAASAFRPRSSSLRDDWVPGLERIVHGLFKKLVLTVIVAPYVLTSASRPVAELTPLQIVVGLYAEVLYYYFDFAGYTDLAIGSARMLGFALPENFDSPLLKRNIQQLWANTHMSLTGWLTDYVYWPLVRRMRAIETLRRRPVLTSNAAIVMTFLLCGAWHGETINFLLWGLYHGVGIATVNTYQRWKRRVRSAVAISYFASPLSYGVGVLLTFNFFAVGLLFWLSPAQLGAVYQRVIQTL